MNKLKSTELPKKPRAGAACNGCGLCCAVELCEIAEVAFKGASAPCPALKITPDGSRSYCELVIAERAGVAAGLLKEPLIANSLGIGLGCGMPDDDLPESLESKRNLYVR